MPRGGPKKTAEPATKGGNGANLGFEARADDGEPFPEKMQRFAASLCVRQAEAAKLDVAIAANLKDLDYGL